MRRTVCAFGLLLASSLWLAGPVSASGPYGGATGGDSGDDLARDGSETMTGDLDMNGNEILNLPNGYSSGTDAPGSATADNLCDEADEEGAVYGYEQPGEPAQHYICWDPTLPDPDIARWRRFSAVAPLHIQWKTDGVVANDECIVADTDGTVAVPRPCSGIIHWDQTVWVGVGPAYIHRIACLVGNVGGSVAGDSVQLILDAYDNETPLGGTATSMNGPTWSDGDGTIGWLSIADVDQVVGTADQGLALQMRASVTDPGADLDPQLFCTVEGWIGELAYPL